MGDRIYDYTNQRETGDASNLYWGNFSKQLTESQLRSEFNASDNGQLRAAFGSFDNYLAYMNERQDLIDAGQLKADWWDTGVALIDPTTLGREAGMDDKALENTIIQAGAAEGEKGYSAQAGQMYTLYQKYTGNSGPWYNKDGDKFEWNGSSFVKTAKVDDHNWGPAIRGLVLAGVTIGAANQLVGLINGLTATQSQMAINALSSAVTSGGDPKAIVGSVLGQLGGNFLANSLVTYSGPGSQLLTAGVANGVADAIQQGITNGDIDLNSVIESGLFGAGTEAAGQLIEAMILGPESGGIFDLDGLIPEDSELFKTINGTFNEFGAWQEGGLISGVRGAVNQFVEQNITGGEWWENATESYDEIDVFDVIDENGIKKRIVAATLYDGTVETFDSWNDFINAGFQNMAGEGSVIWDWVSNNLDKIPDEWYETLNNWMNSTASSSGGSFETEGGTNVTVTSSGGGDGGDGGAGGGAEDFNCANVNRQQVAGATKEEECGGCLEGYQSDEFGICVAVVNKVCLAGQAWNDVAGMCVDEIFYTVGSPCNMEDGTQGVFDANGDCIFKSTGTNGGDGSGGGDGTGGKAGDACTVEETKEAGTLQDDGQGNLTCVATGTGTGGTGGTGDTRKAGDACKTDDNKAGTLQENEEGILVCVATTTTDDTITTTTDTCNNGATNYPDCDQCPQGQTLITGDDGVVKCGTASTTTTITTTTGTTECKNNATIESDCNECADGSLPSEHQNNDCNQLLIITGVAGPNLPTNTKCDGNDLTLLDDSGNEIDRVPNHSFCISNGITKVDCTLVECQSPRPDGEAGVAWDKCCTDDTTVIGGGGTSNGCKLVECEAPRPEGELGALWDTCCKEKTVDPTPITTGSGGGGGGGGGGGVVGSGGGMFTGSVSGISYTPQPLPGIQSGAPVNAMASLEGLIGRMLTGNIS